MALQLIEAHHSKANRHRCTAEDPWDRPKGKYAMHPDAVMIDPERYPGAINMQCPHCGVVFKIVVIKKKRQP